MTQDLALSILKTGANAFLTGEPGAGKTHTINAYTNYLRGHGIEVAITASTGIAATHIGGMTIHSWSGIGIKTRLDKNELNKIATTEYIVKRVRKSKVLIIEEVSMLLPGTLAIVDAVCREIRQNTYPFGGMQVVFIGDFFQLPPIFKNEVQTNTQTEMTDEDGGFDDELRRARFSYDAPIWRQADPVVCYLTEQHRQDDSDFLNLLSAIRRNAFTDHHLKHIASRKIEQDRVPDDVPKLFSHNVNVDRINNTVLAKLSAEPQVFTVVSQGPEALVAILKKSCLSPEILTLKVGAAVMFTKNNPKEGFVNGTLGEVETFDETTGHPIVKTKGGRKIEVEPMEWAVEENGKVRARIAQLPLRLAWAITVHKSQGMSLDAAVMDLSDVFEFGQGYVALSRVRRLSGLYILGWNTRAFQVHPEVLAKDQTFRKESDDAQTSFTTISQAELQKMQDDFISLCGGTRETRPSSEQKRKGDTYNETLLLWDKGENIADIAKIRKLKEETILSHIETLFLKGKINPSDLPRLISPTLVRALPKIHAEFRRLQTDKLSGVFNALNGKYSYADLRIARMLLEKE